MDKAEKRFLEKIRTKVSKAIADYNLITNGDTIIIGISGGKDSMALLDILDNRRKALSIQYKIIAVHIQLTDVPYHTDASYLSGFCKDRNVEFHLLKDDTEIIRENKQPCFYCAWNRRRLLFEFAGKIKAGKVALGHHKDDAVETLLMNMVRHGEISSFPVKLKMFNGAFELIRPLIYTSDKELKRYVEIIGYKPLPYDCMFSQTNQREVFKNIIRQFYKISPDAVDNIFSAMKNIDSKHLP
jgi:tRNA(Ile)-lysidine synthase TilS/MesJ